MSKEHTVFSLYFHFTHFRPFLLFILCIYHADGAFSLRFNILYLQSNESIRFTLMIPQIGHLSVYTLGTKMTCIHSTVKPY